MSYHNLIDHHAMVFDQRRNEYYQRAIEQCVTPDSVVLDLGAGLGILGMLAAKAGAKKVYLVDPSPVVLAAEQIAKGNKLTQVECLHGSLDEIELDEKVDVIISVFTGNFLLTEDLLPILFNARDKFLKPGGHLIPSSASMHIMPVAIDNYAERKVFRWFNSAQSKVLGIDLSAVHQYAVNALYYERFNNARLSCFSAPQPLTVIDFHTATAAECFATVSFEAESDGTMHGWIGWFDMVLGQDTLSTAPTSPSLHWSQAFLPLQQPTTLSRGDRLSVDLKRPQYGEFTWISRIGEHKYKQSSFLRSPRKAGVTKKSTPL